MRMTIIISLRDNGSKPQRVITSARGHDAEEVMARFVVASQPFMPVRLPESDIHIQMTGDTCLRLPPAFLSLATDYRCPITIEIQSV